MQLFAKLLGSNAEVASVQGAPPVGGAAASGDSGLSADRVEAALQAAHAEGVAQGAQAERERSAAVFASDEGRANMAMAAWMLAANPVAPADAIVAQLKTLPISASGPAPVSAVQGEGAAVVAQQLAQTPLVDLNGGKPGANANDGQPGPESADKLWDSIQRPDNQANVTRGGFVFGKKTGN